MTRLYITPVLLVSFVLSSASSAFGQADEKSPTQIEAGFVNEILYTDFDTPFVMESNVPAIQLSSIFAFPTGGFGSTFIDSGVRGNIGVWLPLGPGTSSADGGWTGLAGKTAFDYGHWFGNENVQINGPATNSVLDSANTWVGELGLELVRIRPIPGGGFVICGVGVSGRAGAFTANLNPIAFNPNLGIVNLANEPNTSAFLSGYRVDFRIGYVFRNGIRVSANAGIGQDWTDAVQNKTSSTSNVFAGIQIHMPLGRLLGQASYESALSQGMISNIGTSGDDGLPMN